jgi:enamine deaminase RidA (YjgF/YER057c/UK114 family)
MSERPEQRIEKLRLVLPEPPAPTGLYRGAVRHGDLVFVSGHAPTDENGWQTGVLGDTVTVEEGRVAARTATLGCLATLKDEIGELARVSKVVKVVGMMRAAHDFREHPRVMDGCTSLLIGVFGEKRGRHARSAVGMGSLPFGVVIEIEMIVAIETSRR